MVLGLALVWILVMTLILILIVVLRLILVWLLVVTLRLALVWLLVRALALWLALGLSLGLRGRLIQLLRLVSRLAVRGLLVDYAMKTLIWKESNVISGFILCNDPLVFYLEVSTLLEHLFICADDFPLSHDKTYYLYQ